MSRLARSPQTPQSDAVNIEERGSIKHSSTQRPKRPRETCCEDQIKELRDEIKKMFLDMDNKHELRLNKLSKDVAEIKAQNSDIQKSNQEIEKTLQVLTEQYEKMSTRVEVLEKKCSQHLLYIDTLENKLEDIQRSMKSTTVEFRNIPCSSNNDETLEPDTIVQNTCKALNVEINSNDIKDVFRIKGKSGSCTIVANFTRVTKKNEVIKSSKDYNRKHPNDRLNSNKIGLPGIPAPVYISEGLTSKGRRLFYLARDLSATAEYKYCWTTNGKVFVRKTDSAPYVEIKSEADITKLKIST